MVILLRLVLLLVALLLGAARAHNASVLAIQDFRFNPFYNASFGPSASCVNFLRPAGGGSGSGSTPGVSNASLSFGQFGCDTSPKLLNELHARELPPRR